MQSNNKHTAFYKNTIWQFGLQAIKYVFPLVTLPYLTRVLEPEGYALYAYVVSFMSFAQMFIDFGFNLSGTKDIARAISRDEENRIVGSIMQARVLLCVLASVVVYIVVSHILITSVHMTYTMAAFIAVCGKALAPDFVFQGHEDMGPLTTRLFIAKGFSTVLTFVFVHSFDDIIWIPLLDIASSAIALAWSFAVARRKFGLVPSLVPISNSINALRTSAIYCFSNISASVYSGFTTIFIGITITDPNQVSYWSLAMTAVSAIQSLYSPIVNSLYPHMIASKDFRFARKVAIGLLPVLLFGTMLFASLHNVIFMLLGGEAYMSGSWVVSLVSPVILFSFYGMLFGWPVLGASGYVRPLTTTTVVSAIMCIVGLLTLGWLSAPSLYSICVIRIAVEAVQCFSRLVLAWWLVFGLELPAR